MYFAVALIQIHHRQVALAGSSEASTADHTRLEVAVIRLLSIGIRPALQVVVNLIIIHVFLLN